MKMTTSLTPIGGLLALGLALPALAAPSTQFPTYTVGPQKNGSIIVSNLQRITPAGTLVNLGTQVRAKAIALNPTGNHTAAVLLMGASAPVKVIDTRTGAVLQTFIPAQDNTGSYGGITYSADGKHLFFSQDSSNLEIASVSAKGLLTEYGRVALPATTAIPLYTPGTAYPGGIAVTSDGKSAYVLLNQNNTVGVVSLAGSTPTLTQQIAVGNAPNSIVIAGGYAYVSNEGGRPARSGDFTDISSGTPIVSDPATDSASTGTISVINLATNQVVGTIDVGLHPAGMTVHGSTLYVANAYSETVSLIDLGTNKVVKTINAGIPFYKTFGAMPNSIATDGTYLFVAEYTANAIAVINLATSSLIGYIPTAYGPSSVVYDAAGKQLIVADDKGTGTQGSLGTAHGVTAYNTHQDTGTASLIKVPSLDQFVGDTVNVVENNHWDLLQNTLVGPAFVNAGAKPVAVPAHIGEPSLIKHVFLIIKENRTYDQILGDVAKGNGDASLAVFAQATPNQHALIQRFPLLDNVYAPSRQSADGHPWIVSSISAYANDILSPDWVRSYPGGNSNDEMTYTPKGFLWQTVQAAGHSVKMYGEWSGSQSINGKYTWSDWYNYANILEGKATGTSPITKTTDTETTTVPSAAAILDPHYPSFNTGIPDQYRVDYYLPIFQQQEATNTLPDLTIMWLPDDHTSGLTPGFPIPTAAQADNDLALGRIVDAVSHGKDWPTTAIFVEEDDAQDGVDHVDGHRQPVYVISPYAKQSAAKSDSTSYTAESINRTIENILGAQPLTQFDLTASPMRTAFTDTPNDAPFTTLPPTVPLNTFPTPTTSQGASNDLRGAWTLASAKLMQGHTNHADSVDENVLNHVIWYASTGFARPYPGEKKVLPPAAFHPHAPTADSDD